jgi:dipeptidyl aminopeptidase/acylaminoacyl peptidase
METSREMLRFTLLSLPLILAQALSVAGQPQTPREPITIDDLVSYTRIRNLELSADGRWVTYLSLQPILAENRYDVTRFLQRTGADAPTELTTIRAAAGDVFNLDTGEVKNLSTQAAWSSDGRVLAYTKNSGEGVELRLRHVGEGRDETIGRFPSVEIVGWNNSNTLVTFKELASATESAADHTAHDPALRVTDDMNFWTPPWYEKSVSRRALRELEYRLSDRRIARAKVAAPESEGASRPNKYSDRQWPMKAHETKYVLSPQRSPSEKLEAFVGLGVYHTNDVSKAYRDFFIGVKTVDDNAPPKEFVNSPNYIGWLAWRSDGQEVHALHVEPTSTAVIAVNVEDGRSRELLRTNGVLMEASWARDGRSFVAIRQTSSMPDELVHVDVKSRHVRALAAPNAGFARKRVPPVRFMRVNNPLGGRIFGRLVLPNNYIKGRRYPLVFTTYRAGAGFLEGAVGDEFPIFPYAAHGFVVFAMDTGISNMISDSGDAEFTAMRMKRPLDAMETVRRQLVAEGIVDPERCGITGLSYGSDIATHAIVSTRTFKAAGVSMLGPDPIAYVLNSVNREKELEALGLPLPDEKGLETWRKRSSALNAAAITTPVLIQSSDAEALFSIESYKALRRHGVPVDFHVYPGEGHLKFQPVNKLYVYRRNLDWMRFWLQGQEDPEPVKADEYARWRAMRDAFTRREAKATR